MFAGVGSTRAGDWDGVASAVLGLVSERPASMTENRPFLTSLAPLLLFKDTFDPVVPKTGVTEGGKANEPGGPGTESEEDLEGPIGGD